MSRDDDNAQGRVELDVDCAVVRWLYAHDPHRIEQALAQMSCEEAAALRVWLDEGCWAPHAQLSQAWRTRCVARALGRLRRALGEER